MEKLARIQENFRHEDSVTVWMTEEDWEPLEEEKGDDIEVVAPAYDQEMGFSASEIKARYAHWCRRHGDKPFDSNLFYQRVQEEGVEMRQPRAAKRQRRYFPPAYLLGGDASAAASRSVDFQSREELYRESSPWFLRTDLIPDHLNFDVPMTEDQARAFLAWFADSA